MARRIKDADLINRTSREKLAIRGRPHWRRIEQDLAIGYRRLRGRSGTWTVRFYAGDGGYEFDVIGTADDRSDADGITVSSFDQAVTKARALHTERAKQAAGIHGPLTVAAAMDDYVKHLDHEGKNTDQLERISAKYILPLLGQHEVGKLTSKDLNAWKAQVAAMPAKGKRPFDAVARKSSANGTLGKLRAALNHAFHNGRVPSNSAWASKMVPKFKGVDRSRVCFLSIEESKRLINAASGEFKPMVTAALQTGCRHSELCGLKVKDLDIDNQSIFISHSKTKETRHVNLTDEGVALFANLAAGRRANDPLIQRNDGLPFNTSQQVRRMKHACKIARIENVTFHGLRHTFASTLIKAGVPLKYVAESLGHTSIAMVEKHYGHLIKSHVKETIRANVPSYGFVAESNVRAIKQR
ncbi:MAG: site-specific integrase [Xanthobacteraceae bacterium]